MKINRIVLILPIFAIFFLVIGSLIWGNGYTEDNKNNNDSSQMESVKKTDIEWFVFSASKYEFERGLVKKKEYIHNSDLKYGGKIYIALADLKGDGSKEIISYLDVASFCGSMGCTFNIYQIHNKKLTSLLPRGFDSSSGFPISVEIDQTGHQKSLGMFHHTTKGWHDIVLHGSTVWQWNGNNYGIGNE
jgi:hypothetical protein